MEEDSGEEGETPPNIVIERVVSFADEGSDVVVLRNMVGADEVDEELQEEVQEECSKYGEVERVIIYQERQSEEEDAEILVKIFVEFKEPASAKKCKDALNGRYFGGRIVSADIYDQDLFEHNDLSG